MFLRLLKYDFRSILKQFAFIWPAALVLAVVNRFTLSGLDSTNAIGETTAGIAMLIYIAILMAMFIITAVFVIQRFYKGLLGDEGYLMHTLPVRPWQLIASKLLSAVVLTLISILIAMFSVFLLLPIGFREIFDLLHELKALLSYWRAEIFRSVFTAILYAAEFLLYLACIYASGYLQLYLAMALGHLFNKNRVAMSVIAYIVINVIMSSLFFPSLRIATDFLSPLLTAMSPAQGFQSAIWLGILRSLLLSAIYFAGTEYILRKKLNLE